MDVHTQAMANAAAGELPAAVQAMAREASDGLKDKITSGLMLKSVHFPAKEKSRTDVVDGSQQRMASSPKDKGRPSSQAKGQINRINRDTGVLGRDSPSRPSKVMSTDTHSSRLDKDSARDRMEAASHGRHASGASACVG